MSNAWKRGSTRRWRKIRQWVLARDKYTCLLKLEGCTHKATQVHHVAGKKFGDDPALLVSACRPCNLKIGDPTKGNDPPNKAVTKW
jgi:5-methylcytosine-specific restriction endonuclease McrA